MTEGRRRACSHRPRNPSVAVNAVRDGTWPAAALLGRPMLPGSVVVAGTTGSGVGETFVAQTVVSLGTSGSKLSTSVRVSTTAGADGASMTGSSTTSAGWGNASLALISMKR